MDDETSTRHILFGLLLIPLLGIGLSLKALIARGLRGLIQRCAIVRKDSRYQKENNYQPLICRNFSSYVKCWL